MSVSDTQWVLSKTSAILSSFCFTAFFGNCQGVLLIFLSNNMSVFYFMVVLGRYYGCVYLSFLHFLIGFFEITTINEQI